MARLKSQVAVNTLLLAGIIVEEAHLVRDTSGSLGDEAASLLARAKLNVPHAGSILVTLVHGGVLVLALLDARSSRVTSGAAEHISRALRGVLGGAAARASAGELVVLADRLLVAGGCRYSELASSSANTTAIIESTSGVSIALHLIRTVRLEASLGADLASGVVLAHEGILGAGTRCGAVTTLVNTSGSGRVPVAGVGTVSLSGGSSNAGWLTLLLGGVVDTVTVHTTVAGSTVSAVGGTLAGGTPHAASVGSIAVTGGLVLLLARLVTLTIHPAADGVAGASSLLEDVGARSVARAAGSVVSATSVIASSLSIEGESTLLHTGGCSGTVGNLEGTHGDSRACLVRGVGTARITAENCSLIPHATTSIARTFSAVQGRALAGALVISPGTGIIGGTLSSAVLLVARLDASIGVGVVGTVSTSVTVGFSRGGGAAGLTRAGSRSPSAGRVIVA